jgi:transposase
VLTMEKVVEIQRLKYEEQKTYEEIQTSLGVSSKTVSKALNRPEEFADGYCREVARGRPALGPYVEKIEELLKGKNWAQEKGRVVRRTARWVFRKLKKEGYEGAESTVRTYIRERFKQPRPACPIEHPPGDEVQFDFGACRVKIAEEVWLIHFVGAIFCYSTRRFLFAYPRERQECLFDAIERTYQLAGGVSDRATLDNTTLAVKKILEGGDRDETQEYARFRALLGVNPRYTTPGAGWEKGHVEGTVGWAKRQILLDLEVKDWQELWQVLREECDKDARERRHGEEGKLVDELFEEERGILRPFPYEGRRSYRRRRGCVSPGGLVFVDGSRYSVPISLRGRYVRLELYWDEVVVKSEAQEVVRYPRDWSGRGEHYRVEHYLELLRRAPALLDHGKPFARMPEWLHETRQALADDKCLVELLLSVDGGKYTIRELEEAATATLRSGCVTKALIEQRALLQRGSSGGEVAELQEEECGSLAHHRFTIESAELYDELIWLEREVV